MRLAAAGFLAFGVNRTRLPCDAAPPCGDAAPAALRLTALEQLRLPAHCVPPLHSLERRRVGGPFGTSRRPGIVFPGGAARVVSDAPCRAPRRCRAKPGALARYQNRFRRPLVNEDDFPGPKRLPPTSAVWTRFRAVHFQNWLTTRHRYRRFATDGPASDTRSPPPRSRAERLDRSTFPDALHARARTATHRSSTSATDAIREHHHGCPNSAAPHPQSPAGAALFSKRAAFRRRLELRMAAGCFRSAASRDVTGQGLHVETRFASSCGASHHDRSR